MTHTISKEILRPICEELHKRKNDFPFRIYSDEYKADMYQTASIIILEWEKQKQKIVGKDDA